MEKIEQLIHKFWTGKATEPERRELLEQLQHNEEVLGHFLEGAYPQEGALDKTSLLDKAKASEILSRIQVSTGMTATPPQKPVRRLVISMRWAASILIVLGIGFALPKLYQQYFGSPNTAQVISSVIDRHNDTPSEMVFMLPDGSVISLKPGSRISYKTDYDVLTRDISLNGEARFWVVHDTLRPFSVTANGFTTTALGTEFVVSTLAAGQTHIKLLSGKVVVRSTAASEHAITDTYLNPGDDLRVTNASGEIFTHNSTQAAKEPQIVNNKSETGLLKNAGPLNFDKAPLTLVFDRISADRNIQITSNSSGLRGLSFTGHFQQEDSLDVILSVICRMNDLSWKRDGDNVIINQK
jgi:transmembrane sensor